METIHIEVLCVNTSEIKKAQKGGAKQEVQMAYRLTLMKGATDFPLDKLTTIFTKCLQTPSVPSTWKTAIIIIIHKTGDIKDLKNYRPISLLSVEHNFLTNVFTNRNTATLDSN